MQNWSQECSRGHTASSLEAKFGALEVSPNSNAEVQIDAEALPMKVEETKVFGSSLIFFKGGDEG